MDASSSAATSDKKVRGDKMSSLAHLFFAVFLSAGVIVLIPVSRSYSLSKNLDFISLYSYSKSSPSPSGAADRIRGLSQTYTGSGGAVTKALSDPNSWINDANDASGCQDMTAALFPSVSLATTSAVSPYSASVAVGATCQVSVYLKLGPMEEQISFKNVTLGNIAGCAAGKSKYTVSLSVPAGYTGQTLTGTYPSVVVDKELGIAYFDPAVPGVATYQYRGAATWTSCAGSTGLRTTLVDTMLSSTDCSSSAFNSPACTCVRALANRISSWQARLVPKPSAKMYMSDVVSQGVQRCLELRKTHDIREPLSNPYPRSSALLIFCAGLLLNAVFGVVRAYSKTAEVPTYAQVIVFFVLLCGVLVCGLVPGRDGGIGEFETVLTIVLPLLVHISYLVYLHIFFNGAGSTPEPFLHPVMFDVCLCALSLYTLTERGVVQLEYLLTDLIKCHVVAASYIAVIWYHKYGSSHSVLSTEFVQQAYLIIFAAGLTLSASGLVVPYPSKQGFEFHWLLPSLFTYVAFLNPGWAMSLKMQNHLNAPSNSTVNNFNAVAGFLFLLVGSIFFMYFLSDHITVYGAKNFRYPDMPDAYDYAMYRGLVIPVTSVTMA